MGTCEQPQARPSTESSDGPLFFYRSGDLHGVFSQWHYGYFCVSNSLIEDVCGTHLGSSSPGESTTFNCAEQCMMYCKAAVFSDLERQRWILEAESPRAQQTVGRSVKNYDETRWSTVRSQIVEMANYAKFSQDVERKKCLLDTGNRELVEAARHDRVWGIGFYGKTSKERRIALENRENWGENRLGKALERVRARLRSEEDVEMGSD